MHDKIGWFDTGQKQDLPHHGDVPPQVVHPCQDIPF